MSGDNSIGFGGKYIDDETVASNSVTEDDVGGVGPRRIVGVVDPTNAQDAATKNYVDTTKALLDSPAFTGIPRGIRQDFTATLPHASWTGASAPYTKEVMITGILETDRPDINLDFSDTNYADVAGIQADWTKIYRVVAGEGTLTFYASAVPTIDIPLEVKVVR